MQHQHVRPLHLASFERDLSPRGTFRDRDKVAVNGPRHICALRKSHGELARRPRGRHQLFWFDCSDWEAEDWPQLRVFGVVAADFAEGGLALGQSGRVDDEVKTLAGGVEHQEIGHDTPRRRGLERHVHLKVDLVLVVAVHVERGRCKHVDACDALRVRRVPEIETARPVARRNGGVDGDVCCRRVKLRGEKRVCGGHLEQTSAERPWLNARHLCRRVFDGAPNAGRRVSDPLRLERRENQRNTAAAVGRGHRCAIHQLLALQRPRWHRCDGAAWRHYAHSHVPVGRWAPRRPGIICRGQGLAQGVFHLHHTRRHIRPHTNERRAGASGRSNCRERWAVVAGRRDKHDAVTLHKLARKLREATTLFVDETFPVAHVDELAAVVARGYQRTHQPHARLHGAKAAVADFARDYLRARSHAIQLRALRKVGCHDSRHMRAVRASVADDREALALFVDGHAVVKQQRHFLAARHGLDGAVLALVAIVAQRRARCQVACAVAVNHCAPRAAVVENNAVEHGACVRILFRRLL
mmetsp:Transcript_24701/g.39825  ORF Transcript_24701/g.39825 Transcript_24701/m.39825 type:complete len:527 (+) Transcript_24701:2179-3759(+)